MEAWKERLRAFDGRLAEWNRTFHREFRRWRRSRRRFLRRLSAAEAEDLAAQARRTAGEEILVELFALLDELCGAYLEAKLPQDAAKLRAWVGDLPALFTALWSYVEQAPELIRTPADSRRLELALAAVSLDDGRVDALQRDAALGRLYLAARRAGIDPEPRFEAAARVSNPGTGGGGSRTREILLGFNRSYYFEREVRPHLPRV